MGLGNVFEPVVQSLHAAFNFRQSALTITVSGERQAQVQLGQVVVATTAAGVFQRPTCLRQVLRFIACPAYVSPHAFFKDSKPGNVVGIQFGRPAEMNERIFGSPGKKIGASRLNLASALYNCAAADEKKKT